MKRAAIILVFSLLFAASSAVAQGSGQLPGSLTAEEQRSIEKERGEKGRVEALLKVSSAKLAAARTCLTTENYEESRDQIKTYGALIKYTSTFISGMPKKESDKRKLYKMVELSLRRD